MPARPYRRKDLKADEFVSTAARLTRWLLQRRRRIGWALLLAVLVGSAALGTRAYRQRQEERAAALLAVALEIYRSPVEPPGPQDPADGPPAGSGGRVEVADAHGPPGHRHFDSERAKYEAAREELAAIVRQYGHLPSGKVAAYYLGLSEAGLGNAEAAEAALRRAADSSPELVATLALYRLGLLQLEQAEAAAALATFETLLSREPRAFPVEEALVAKAQAHEALGDRHAALAAYRRVIDEYADSFAAAEARGRAEELAAELGLEPGPGSS